MSRGISDGMTRMLLKATFNWVCSSCPTPIKKMFQTVAGVDEAPAHPATQGGEPSKAQNTKICCGFFWTASHFERSVTSLINTRGPSVNESRGVPTGYLRHWFQHQPGVCSQLEALNLPSAGFVFDSRLTSSYPNLFCGFTHFLLGQLLFSISTYDY